MATQPRTASTVEAGPVTVVVLGSSTAAGFGLADPAEGWVAVYSEALEEADAANEVVNLAVSGHSTSAVLPTGTAVSEGRPQVDADRNITAALELDPDAVIVNLPSNDAAMGVPIDEQMENLDTIVAAAEAEEVPVWIGTTQPRRLDEPERSLLVEGRDRILEEYGDHAVDLWIGLAEPDGTIDPALDSGDGIHLNPKGHAIVAEAFLAARIPEAVGDR